MKEKQTLPVAPLNMDFGWGLEGDRVAILPLDAETKTKGGIIIPDTAQEKPRKGHIGQLGYEITENEDGTKDRKCKFFVGQLIQFGKYAGSEIEGEDGREYLVMRLHDILAYKPK